MVIEKNQIEGSEKLNLPPLIDQIIQDAPQNSGRDPLGRYAEGSQGGPGRPPTGDHRELARQLAFSERLAAVADKTLGPDVLKLLILAAIRDAAGQGGVSTRASARAFLAAILTTLGGRRPLSETEIAMAIERVMLSKTPAEARVWLDEIMPDKEATTGDN